jgi:predicted GNAT family N-acyltransferase
MIVKVMTGENEMTNYEIKHVQSTEELNDAYAVRKKVFVEEQQVPPELEIDEYENKSEHFVAYDEQHIPVGAGRLRPLSNTEAKVERICVAENVRGNKLGAQIMHVLENVAQEKGIQTLLLHAQDHAERFYHRIGYETISEPFDEAGIVHVKMKKEL